MAQYLLGREAHRDYGGHRVVGVTGLPAELTELAAEFPDYDFAPQQTSGGLSIIATRHGGCAQSGLYAVVTRDPDEMRRTLLEQHEQPAGPPGEGRHQQHEQPAGPPG